MGRMGNIMNPVHNAVAAIRYMMARYGHIVGPSSGGYAMGGRLPFAGWFGGGANFTANSPMLLGVGERGRESVSITPGGGGVAGGVRIDKVEINNHRSGDIRRQMEREIEQALNNVSRKLETQDGDDSRGAMA